MSRHRLSPAMQRWVAEVEEACAAGRPAPLTVVSLLRGAPAHAPGRLAELARASGYAYGTVSALSWLSRRIPAGVQRDELGLAVHAAVAKLPAAEQTRRLDEVAREQLTAAELRRRIAADQRDAT